MADMLLMRGEEAVAVSVLLIIESRIQLRAVRNEMKFTWEAGRQLAPSDLIASHERRRWIRRWFE